jgi:hypothetical protein
MGRYRKGAPVDGGRFSPQFCFVKAHATGFWQTNGL